MGVVLDVMARRGRKEGDGEQKCVSTHIKGKLVGEINNC